MAEFAAAATVASAIFSGANALGLFGSKASQAAAPPPPPAPIEAPPTLQTPQINTAGIMQRQRAAAAGGIMANIGTSPSGDMSAASTTGKTLLGA